MIFGIFVLSTLDMGEKKEKLRWLNVKPNVQKVQRKFRDSHKGLDSQRETRLRRKKLQGRIYFTVQ